LRRALLTSDAYASYRRSSDSSIDVDVCVCAHFLNLLVVTASGALDGSFVVTAG